MRNFKIPLDIYETDVIVYVGSMQDFEQVLVSKKISLMSAPPEEIGGLTIGARGDVLVYFPAFKALDSKSLRCIVHEMTHVSWHVSMKLGKIFDIETQEAQTYLIDYLVVNCAKKMFKGFK